MFECLSLFFLKIRLWVFLNPFLCIWIMIFLHLLNLVFLKVREDSSSVIFRALGRGMVGILSICILFISLVLLYDGLTNAFNYDSSFLNTSYISQLLDQGKLSLDEGYKVLEFLQGNERKLQLIFSVLNFLLMGIFFFVLMFLL